MIRSAAMFSVIVLLLWTGTAQAFSFCFSFGGGNSGRGHAGYYNFPPPGPALYPAYPYSPVAPAFLYGPDPPPSIGAAGTDSSEPQQAPRPTLGWPR